MRARAKLWALWVVFASICTEAQAEVPSFLPVQGRLVDAEGAPLMGDYTLTFTLYDALEGGLVIHTETVELRVEEGQFYTYLGRQAANALDLSLFEMSGVYLGVRVEDEAELKPRILLATVPYAAASRISHEAFSLEGHSVADFAVAGHTHNFSELIGVPVGILNNERVFVPVGNGIQQTSEGLSIDSSIVQSRVSGRCIQGAIRAIAEDGTVTCQSMVESTLSVGDGLEYDADRTLRVSDYQTIARKDARSGNQSFGNHTLYLAYSSNRVGIGTNSPRVKLEVDGDIYVSGAYLTPRKAFFRNIGPSEFASDDPGFVNSGLYAYSATDRRVNALVHLTLAQGAVIRQVSCFYGDLGVGRIEDFDLYLFRRRYNSAQTEDITRVLGAPEDFNSPTELRSVDMQVPGEVIANNDYGYYLRVSWDNAARSLGSSYRFYGCRVRYELSNAASH